MYLYHVNIADVLQTVLDKLSGEQEPSQNLKIRNYQLHQLCQQSVRLPDEGQHALTVRGSLVKKSDVTGFIDKLVRGQASCNSEESTMHTAKQDALNIIQQLPDDADTEEMIYQLYVLENIRRGRQDAAENKTQTAEEVLKDIQSW